MCIRTYCEALRSLSEVTNLLYGCVDNRNETSKLQCHQIPASISSDVDLATIDFSCELRPTFRGGHYSCHSGPTGNTGCRFSRPVRSADQGAQPGVEAQSRTVPRRFCLPAVERRSGKLEVTDCDLQFVRKNGAPSPSVRFHSRRCRDAFLCTTQRACNSDEHRNHASFRALAGTDGDAQRYRGSCREAGAWPRTRCVSHRSVGRRHRSAGPQGRADEAPGPSLLNASVPRRDPS
jgi:hypothetical protein